MDNADIAKSYQLGDKSTSDVTVHFENKEGRTEKFYAHSFNVFFSAIRLATSVAIPCPPFGDELKISAQEQVEYMLGEDEDAPLVIADEEVKAEVRLGPIKIRLSFEKDSSLLILESDKLENKITCSLSDLEWMCSILTKMGLMKDFATTWDEISKNILRVAGNEKIALVMWGFKVKL